MDIDSKLDSYLQVNPNLQTPSYNDNQFEIERIHITRIRTGSHNLLIESGRFSTVDFIYLFIYCSNIKMFN